MKFTTIPIMISLLLSANCFCQVKVFDITQAANAKKEGGIIYRLPQTKIRAEAIVKKSIFEKGDLYDYDWLMRNKFYLQKYLNYTSDSIIGLLRRTDEVALHSLKETDISLKAIPVADYSKSYRDAGHSGQRNSRGRAESRLRYSAESPVGND